MDISTGAIEPISVLMLVLVQIGGRFLKFELTKAQEKLIQNKLVQAVILFAIVLIASKNVITSILVVCVAYIFIYVLFNENHQFNILSKEWLKNEGLVSNDKIKSLKEIYYNNIQGVLV